MDTLPNTKGEGSNDIKSFNFNTQTETPRSADQVKHRGDSMSCGMCACVSLHGYSLHFNTAQGSLIILTGGTDDKISADCKESDITLRMFKLFTCSCCQCHYKLLITFISEYENNAGISSLVGMEVFLREVTLNIWS